MISWFPKVANIFKNKELRRKILFVFFVFVIFRLAANIPIPGIDKSQLAQFFSNSQLFGFLNIFAGGTLSNFSIVLLGMGPYITAVIVFQLATMIFPALERMYKEEGEQGRKKFNQYARIATIPLAALQGYGMLAILQSQNVIAQLSSLSLINFLVTVAAGAVFLMWLGELISERGIGNGVSLLIFAGIVAQLPRSLGQTIVTWDISKLPSYLAFVAVAILMIGVVVAINEARRNIPVSYTKRVRGMKVYGGTSSYLPMNINPAGVMPIIFALAILMFPQIIGQVLAGTGSSVLVMIAGKITWFLGNRWLYGMSYFFLVIGFTYFYTAITFDPKNVASNLQKSGGFIPGIRPGDPTSNYLHYVLRKCLFVGAIFLASVAVMPSLIQGSTGVAGFNFLIGGTALLIVVSVVLDTLRQIKSQMEMRGYESF